MIIVYSAGIFLVAAVLATLIYLPVLKWNGVREKLLLRSLTMGMVSSVVLVVSSMAFGFVLSFSLAKFVSIPGIIAATLVSGHLLRKNLSLPAGRAYAIALGVLSLSGFVVFCLYLGFLAYLM